MYAGGIVSSSNSYAYYRGGDFWTMSPAMYDPPSGYMYNVNSDGSLRYNQRADYDYLEIRPVLSLKSCVLVSSGNGTSGNPYEVELPSACASAEN